MNEGDGPHHDQPHDERRYVRHHGFRILTERHGGKGHRGREPDGRGEPSRHEAEGGKAHAKQPQDKKQKNKRGGGTPGPEEVLQAAPHHETALHPARGLHEGRGCN